MYQYDMMYTGRVCRRKGRGRVHMYDVVRAYRRVTPCVSAMCPGKWDDKNTHAQKQIVCCKSHHPHLHPRRHAPRARQRNFRTQKYANARTNAHAGEQSRRAEAFPRGEGADARPSAGPARVCPEGGDGEEGGADGEGSFRGAPAWQVRSVDGKVVANHVCGCCC